jgi:hypothetical protein
MFFADGLPCILVTLTAAADWSYDGMGGVRLPKSVMASTLKVALQGERVGIASGIPICPRFAWNWQVLPGDPARQPRNLRKRGRGPAR